MTFSSLTESRDADVRAQLEAALQSCERRLAVTLTWHDLSGLCRDENGLPLLPGRHEHRHRLCRLHRRRTYARCEAHCVDEVHAEAVRRRQPFATCCWKGLREVVVPVLHDEQVVAILFAGAWRRSRARPALAGLPPRRAANILELHDELPVWSAEQARDLACQLQLWSQGLHRRIVAQRRTTGGDRASRIRRFIDRHAHRACTLTDLAAELACSTSRAGHIVVEELGCGFQEMLARERIERAKALLVGTEATLARIAASCGFSNEYYFNRAFRRRVGDAPGRWRRKARQRWSDG